MRSAVVLPEPDGPTRTMNSPSFTSRSSASTAGGAPLANTRVAETYLTFAMGDLRCGPGSLDGSHREPADERALGDPADDYHRNRGNESRRGQVRDVQPFLGDRTHQEQRHGRSVRDGQIERQEQLVPCKDYANQSSRYQTRHNDWEDHPADLPNPTRTVEPRGLEQLAGHLQDERPDHPDSE